MDIIALAKECPNLTISIKIEDLIQANRVLLEDVNDIIESKLQYKANNVPQEEYISREKALEILNTSSTTLWRWKKSGYLLPASQLGNKDMYRLSDIMNILEGNNNGK